MQAPQLAKLEEAGARARRLHESWLTRALAAQDGFLTPRIPVRPVSVGGFEKLRVTPEGRARAARWWDSALSRMDASGEGRPKRRWFFGR